MIDDLASYEFFQGCEQSGLYDSIETIQVPDLCHTVTDIAVPSTCYFAVKAVNSLGESSAFSGEATHVFDEPITVPGPVPFFELSWRVAPPAPVVAFSFEDSATNGATTTALVLTPAAAPADGELVLIYANANGSQTLSLDAGGSSWNEPIASETPASESATHSLWWKIANGSEPSTYTVNLSSSDRVRAAMMVFSAAATPMVDLAARSTKYTSTTAKMVANAIDTRVIANNSLSVVFTGKDNFSSAESFTTADNGYTAGPGNVANQATASAYKIYTTDGETFSGNLTIETADAGDVSDSVYSIHISFLEGGAPAGSSLLNPRLQQNQIRHMLAR